MGAAVGLAGCASSKLQPSSDILDRREFPVDASINPCDDFYAYTCNRVMASFKLRDDRSRHGFAFSDSEERLLEKRKVFLASLGNAGQSVGSPRRLGLQAVYKACMDEPASVKEERGFAQDVLKDAYQERSRKELLIWLAGKTISEDFAFVQFDKVNNLDHPEWYDLVVTGTLQNLPERSYYENAELLDAYRAAIAKQLSALGIDQAETRAGRIVNLEKRFAATYPLPAEFRVLFNEKRETTRERLLKNFPSLHLEFLFGKLKKNPHMKIRDITPENFKFLEQALQTEPLQVLQDLYVYRSLQELMDDAYPEVHQTWFDFRKKFLGGPDKRPDRQERCTKLVREGFGKEIDAELLPEVFPNFPQAEFTQLAEKVRSSIVDGISKNPWLSDKTRKRAANKIRVARLQLVKPLREEDWDFNPPAVYDPARKIANARLLGRNLLMKMIDQLGKKRNPDEWEMGPLTVNAYYDPSNNKFVMPIGILQYPFYDPALSPQANLGAVGAVIGHELGHGIDDQGAKYNEKGELKQWMSDAEVREFQSRGAKLISQFDKAGINGKLTIGENIGDFVGLTFAYRTAFPNGQGTAEEKKAFFTQYGRVWCQVIRPKFAELLLKRDPHSPGRARVNEQMKHQAGFAQAFGCKSDDRMTLPAADRLTIW